MYKKLRLENRWSQEENCKSALAQFTHNFLAEDVGGKIEFNNRIHNHTHEIESHLRQLENVIGWVFERRNSHSTTCQRRQHCRLGMYSKHKAEVKSPNNGNSRNSKAPAEFLTRPLQISTQKQQSIHAAIVKKEPIRDYRRIEEKSKQNISPSSPQTWKTF